jgi:hypothetical protein
MQALLYFVHNDVVFKKQTTLAVDIARVELQRSMHSAGDVMHGSLSGITRHRCPAPETPANMQCQQHLML